MEIPALIYACKQGKRGLVEYLVKHDVDINKENRYGETALLYSIKRGNEELVEYLVEHGADIDKENRYGETALFYACKRGNEGISGIFSGTWRRHQ